MASSYTLLRRKFEDLIPRLDALMMVLKSCKGDTCRKPWTALHPSGDVASLKVLFPSFTLKIRMLIDIRMLSRRISTRSTTTSPRSASPNVRKGTSVTLKALKKRMCLEVLLMDSRYKVAGTRSNTRVTGATGHERLHRSSQTHFMFPLVMRITLSILHRSVLGNERELQSGK
jgi:hypothetical protein